MLAFLLRFAISSSNILSSLPIHKPNLTFNFAGIHLQNQHSITLPQMKQISSFAFHNLYISKNLNPFLFSINNHVQLTFSHLTFHKFQSAPIFLTNQAECTAVAGILNCTEHDGPVTNSVSNFVFVTESAQTPEFGVEIISCTFQDISNGESPGGGLSLVFDQSLPNTNKGTVTIKNTTFLNCDSRDRSGSIVFYGGAFAITYLKNLNVVISNTTIDSCFAMIAPFFYIQTDDGSSKVTIEDCDFSLAYNDTYFKAMESSAGITIINAAVEMRYVRIFGDNVRKVTDPSNNGFRQDYIILENCNNSILNHIQFTNITMEHDSGIIRIKNTQDQSNPIVTTLSYLCITPSEEAHNQKIYVLLYSGFNDITVEKVFIYNPKNYTEWYYDDHNFNPELNSPVIPKDIDNNATERDCGYDISTYYFTESIDFTESQLFSESDIFQPTFDFTDSYAFSNSDTYFPPSSPPETAETTEESEDISTSDIQPEDLDVDTGDSSDVGMIIIIVIIVLAIVIIIIIVVCCRKSRSCAGCCMCTCCGKADHAFIFQDDEESSKQELFFPDFGKHNI